MLALVRQARSRRRSAACLLDNHCRRAKRRAQSHRSLPQADQGTMLYRDTDRRRRLDPGLSACRTRPRVERRRRRCRSSIQHRPLGLACGWWALGSPLGPPAVIMPSRPSGDRPARVKRCRRHETGVKSQPVARLAQRHHRQGHGYPATCTSVPQVSTLTSLALERDDPHVVIEAG